MKLQLSQPYFKLLIKAQPKARQKILQSLPPYVLDDMVEILYNVVTGKVKISSSNMKKFNKFKIPLLKLKNAKTKIQRRNIIQKGGIIPVLLPIIGSIASSIIGSAVSGAIRNKMNQK